MKCAWKHKGEGATARPSGTASSRANERYRSEQSKMERAEREAALAKDRGHAAEAKLLAPWLKLVPIGDDLAERLRLARELAVKDQGEHLGAKLLTSFDVAKLAGVHPGTVVNHVAVGYLKASAVRPIATGHAPASLFTEEVAHAYASRIAAQTARRLATATAKRQASHRGDAHA